MANLLEKGNVYSFTFSPDDKHQYFGEKDRMRKFRNFVYEELLMLDSYHIDYTFYIELSEPKTNYPNSRNGPRLHCHGTLQFKSTLSIRNFLLYGLYNFSRWCNYDLDTIDDLRVWEKYITKQQHIIKEEPFSNCIR